MLNHDYGVGAARNNSARGNGGRHAGPHVKRGSVPADNHFAIQGKLAWRGVACSDYMGGAHSKAIDVGAIEWRHIERRYDIVGKHTIERILQGQRLHATR